jgi:hypothetical protein
MIITILMNGGRQPAVEGFLVMIVDATAPDGRFLG